VKIAIARTTIAAVTKAIAAPNGKRAVVRGFGAGVAAVSVRDMGRTFYVRGERDGSFDLHGRFGHVMRVCLDVR
jgi:hypothetical protein